MIFKTGVRNILTKSFCFFFQKEKGFFIFKEFCITNTFTLIGVKKESG